MALRWTSLALLCLAISTFEGDATKGVPTFVAFSVGKTSSMQGRGRVAYEKIFLNIGNGYKSTTNVFVVPVDGVYHMTISGLNYVTKTTTTELFLDMYKNDEYILSVYETKSYFGQASNSVLLQLMADDQVYINARNQDSGLYGTPDQVYATFSGYLVVPIYQVTTYIAGVVQTQPQFS